MAAKKPWYRVLYIQVLVAIAVGVALGHFYPDIGKEMKPLGDAFIALIKMMIAPAIFCTIVHGIASIGDMRKVGRVGIKTLVYFELVSTLALAIGLLVGELLGRAHAVAQHRLGDGPGGDEGRQVLRDAGRAGRRGGLAREREPGRPGSRGDVDWRDRRRAGELGGRALRQHGGAVRDRGHPRHLLTLRRIGGRRQAQRQLECQFGKQHVTG